MKWSILLEQGRQMMKAILKRIKMLNDQAKGNLV